MPAITGNGNAPLFSEEKSIYEELRSSSGLVLEEPKRELAVADIITADGRASSAPNTGQEFAAYRLGHDEAKGVVNLRVDPVEGGSRLTTATLMMYGDSASCRNFGRYWAVIYSGSSLLRIELLETIKRRSEHSMVSVSIGRQEGSRTAIDGSVA